MYTLNENDKTLQEFFAAPVGLDLVAKLDGEKLYGSKSLNISFLKSIHETSRSKPLFDTINRLVWDGTILPCWMNKNIFKLIKYKIFGPSHAKAGVAFYHPISKKVYVSIDNNINAFGFSNNDWLALITIHEMAHLYVGINTSGFFNSFKNILKDFYQTYFTHLLKLSSKPNVDGFIKLIYKAFDINGKFFYSTFKQYRDEVFKFQPLSILGEKEFTETVDLLINCCLVGLVNFETWMKNIKKYTEILGPIRQSYRQLIGDQALKINSLMFQELYLPSEVIAILTETQSQYTTKIYSGLKKI